MSLGDASPQLLVGSRPVRFGGRLAAAVAVTIGVLGMIGFTVPPAADSAGEVAITLDNDPTALITGLQDDRLGDAWSVVSGTWSVENGTAALTASPPQRDAPGIAVADLGSANHWVAATAGQMARGWGLVFRYVDLANYGFVVADPQFASLRVVEVVNGEQRRVGLVAPTATRNGVIVRVDVSGETLRVRVDGKVVVETAVTGRGEAVGLYAGAPGAGDARWTGVRAGVPVR